MHASMQGNFFSLQKNEALPQAAMWMCRGHGAECNKLVTRKKYTETESRVVDAEGWERRGAIIKWAEFLFCKMKRVLEMAAAGG